MGLPDALPKDVETLIQYKSTTDRTVIAHHSQQFGMLPSIFFQTGDLVTKVLILGWGRADPVPHSLRTLSSNVPPPKKGHNSVPQIAHKLDLSQIAHCIPQRWKCL